MEAHAEGLEGRPRRAEVLTSLVITGFSPHREANSSGFLQVRILVGSFGLLGRSSSGFAFAAIASKHARHIGTPLTYSLVSAPQREHFSMMILFLDSMERGARGFVVRRL
jgi:hypothetical protein